MEKNIKIGNIDCHLKTSAAVPKIYRMKFKRDIFVDMEQLKIDVSKKKKNEGSGLSVEVLELFENIAYIIHKHGDPNQPDDIMEWLEQFETFDIYQVLPEIFEMWGLEQQQMSTPKKK